MKEPASPLLADLRFLLFRLRRQRRTLEEGRIDRFLDLSESLRSQKSITTSPKTQEEAELLAACQDVLDGMVPLMERALAQISRDEFETRVSGQIQEFLAKKEEP